MQTVNDVASPRPTTAVSWLLDALRTSILDGTLPAHSIVRQDKIAEVYGVSRTPVREAIRTLEAEGLVVTRPNRGAIVAPLDPEDVLEVFEIRAALESLALRRSIPKLTDEQKAAAMNALTALEQAPPEATSNEHKAFHLSLYTAGGPRLNRLVSQHIDAAGRYLRVEATLAGTMDEDRYEHRALLDAVLAGDVRGATRLIERHIKGTGFEVAEVLRDRNRRSAHDASASVQRGEQ